MESTSTMISDSDDELLLNSPNENLLNNRRCPTCQGTGSVIQSPGLVALIPLDDARLKRRHTFLWIILTIIFCTLIASATIAVLLPRSVHLSIENPIVIDATNNTYRNSTNFYLKFNHHTNIKSDNWVPIRLINLTTSIEHQLVPIGPDTEIFYGHKMFLRPLGKIQTNITIQLNFNTDTMVYRVCHGIFRQMLMFKLQTTLIYADFLLGRMQTTNNISYQYVLFDTVNRRFEELFNSNKLNELVQLYTSNGKLLPPDKNKYERREQIKQFWESAKSAGVKNFYLTIGTFLEAGNDRLVETSSYENSLDKGNYQVI